MEKKDERPKGKPRDPVEYFTTYEELVRFKTTSTPDERLVARIGVHQAVHSKRLKSGLEIAEKRDKPFLGLELVLDGVSCRFEGEHLEYIHDFMHAILSPETQDEINRSVKACVREYKQAAQEEADARQKEIDDHWNKLKTASRPKNKAGGGIGSFKKPGKSRQQWETEQAQKKLEKAKAKAEEVNQPIVTATQGTPAPEMDVAEACAVVGVDPAVEVAQLEKELAALEGGQEFQTTDPLRDVIFDPKAQPEIQVVESAQLEQELNVLTTTEVDIDKIVA